MLGVGTARRRKHSGKKNPEDVTVKQVTGPVYYTRHICGKCREVLVDVLLH